MNGTMKKIKVAGFHKIEINKRYSVPITKIERGENEDRYKIVDDTSGGIDEFIVRNHIPITSIVIDIIVIIIIRIDIVHIKTLHQM